MATKEEILAKIKRLARSTNRRDILMFARQLIYKEMRKEAPVSTVIEAKLPQNLVREFKAMPGVVAENFRAALGVYVIAISGGRNPPRVYIGGHKKLKSIVQEFVIERPKMGTAGYQPLESIGARMSDELLGDFKALPGITAHNIEKALRLYLVVMKGKMVKAVESR